MIKNSEKKISSNPSLIQIRGSKCFRTLQNVNTIKFLEHSVVLHKVDKCLLMILWESYVDGISKFKMRCLALLGLLVHF